ncbi:MAG: 5-formyltetrahydrofolate cyclo-ligase [Lysobacterales bacterium]
MNQSKSKLRQELRSRRSGLPLSLRSGLDEAIGRHLLALVKSRRAVSIACYWPFNGEPDITPVCRQLMSDGRRLALPVITSENGRLMNFHSWQTDTELVKNSYGILEPRQTGLVPVSSLDLLIMPLVGYDLFGNRLGMGQGYYDRCLETIRDLQAPLRVGVAYSLQEMAPAAKKKWDIPLHGIVNEHGWFSFDAQHA